MDDNGRSARVDWVRGRGKSAFVAQRNAIIRERAAAGASYAAIGTELGISARLMRNIVKGYQRPAVQEPVVDPLTPLWRAWVRLPAPRVANPSEDAIALADR